MFNNEEMMLNEESAEKSKTSLFPIVLVLSLLFIPSFIMGSLYYYIIFLWKKYRPTYTLLINIVFSILLLLIGFIISPFDNFEFTTDSILTPYLYISLWIAIWGSYIIILYNAYELKHHPELKFLDGWAKDFKYAKTPWQIRKAERVYEKLVNEEMFFDDKAPIGVLHKPVIGDNIEVDEGVPVFRYFGEASKHTVITGGTGSGKTVTMTNLMKADILANKPLICIDFKDSVDIMYFLSMWAKSLGREFYHFTYGPAGAYRNPYAKSQATYDPLATGSVNEKADMIMNTRKWDTASDVYRTELGSVVLDILTVLDSITPDDDIDLNFSQGTFALLYDVLNNGKLERAISIYLRKMESMVDKRNIDKLKISAIITLYDELKKKNSAKANQVTALKTMMSSFITSDYGNWLVRDTDSDVPHIILDDLVNDSNAPIVLFSFTEEKEKDFARKMGSLIMQDITRVVGEKRKFGNKDLPVAIYIDEVQTAPIEATNALFEKGRSAGAQFTISLQDLSQIEVKEHGIGEALINALLTTTGTYIAHAGASQASAEKISSILGEKKVRTFNRSYKTKSSIFSFNLGNRRNNQLFETEKLEPVLPPEVIQSLESPTRDNGYVSTAVMISKDCQDPLFAGKMPKLARVVQVVVSEEIAKGPTKEYEEAIRKDKHKQFVNPLRQTDKETELQDGVFTTEKKNFEVKVNLPESFSKEDAKKLPDMNTIENTQKKTKGNLKAFGGGIPVKTKRRG